MRHPLLPPLAALITGIVVGRWLEFTVREALWPAVLLALLALPTRSRLLRNTCTLLTAIFLGALTESWHRPGPPPSIDADPREEVVLTGCVVEPSEPEPDREQFTLELAPSARAHVARYFDERNSVPPLNLHYGQRIEIRARIRTPRFYRNPGAFDYPAYLARENIYWTASMIRRSTPQILPGQCGSRWEAWLTESRLNLGKRIANMYGDTRTSALMQALLIGRSAGLAKIWTEDFRRTGTFHALVISGSHVAVLSGLLLFILRRCLKEVPALLITAIATWLYAALAGFTPPVVRAAAGFSLYLVARWMFRRGRTLNLLAAVAIVFLLIDPLALWDASFQLSFLAVAAMGSLAIPLFELKWQTMANATRHIGSNDLDAHLTPSAAQFRVELRLLAETIHFHTKLPAVWCSHVLAGGARFMFFILLTGAISAAIQIGLAVPMAKYFHRVSFTGLSANLLVVPLLEIALPAGFVALATGWLWLIRLTAWLMNTAAQVAAWHARIEPSWRIVDPPILLPLAFTSCLILTALLLRHRFWRWPALASVAVCLGLLLSQPWTVDGAPRVLELTAIDVGQGESLLVMLPEGQRMVIDGGGLLQYGNQQRTGGLDTGEDVVSPYLWSRRIDKIDVLIATHAHTDHTGGLLALMENFHPEELWVGANPPAFLLDAARAKGILIRELYAPAEFKFSGIGIQVLAPPMDYHSAKPGNNDSLALRLSYGQRSFLLTGDMEATVEYQILGTLTHSDVLKIGHHGSKTSTTAEFLDRISPSVAIVSAGAANTFGHPHPDVLRRLLDRHVTILRTDRDGLVTVRTDGRLLMYDGMLWKQAKTADSYNWAQIGGERE